jgi:hypothetical protein
MNKSISLILGIFTIYLSLIVTSEKIAAMPSCSSHITACEKTPEELEKIDYWTNYFFKVLRPEMRGKRVQYHQSLFRREKAAIRQVIRQVVYCSCQEPNLNRYYFLMARQRDDAWRRDRYKYESRYENRYDRNSDERYFYADDELRWDEQLWDEEYYWSRNRDYFFDGLYADLTDAIFYARHPEFDRRISKKSKMDWTSEWTFIRQYFANYEQERFIKQYLIPVCDRDFTNN